LCILRKCRGNTTEARDRRSALEPIKINGLAGLHRQDYKQALELDPKLTQAADMLKELGDRP
jgi:hypothetical protein